MSRIEDMEERSFGKLMSIKSGAWSKCAFYR